MSRRAWFALLLALCPACAREAPAEVERRIERTRSGEVGDRRHLAARVRHEIVAARQHLEQELGAPKQPAGVPCPEPARLRASPGATPLLVRVTDARNERRELLPLSFSAALASDDFSAITPHLVGGRAALWDSAQADVRSEADALAALSALAELRQRRYRAELLVDKYSAPRLFRRKDALRSEWAAGALSGRLVVADLVEARVLCHAAVVVKGDAAGAPTSRRLRETTRERLLVALSERVWKEMGAALATLSPALRLPASEARDRAAHRWAAPPERGLYVAAAASSE